MEVDERPTEQYSDIGGLDKQIQEISENMETVVNTEKVLLFDNRTFLYDRPHLSAEDSQSEGYVSYVLYYEDPAYNKEENSPKAQKMENFRKRFIVGMKLENLCVQEDRTGKHKFLRVTSPLDRLYEEAESLGVELPLYGIHEMTPAHETEEAAIEKRMKKLLNETSRETQVSAPFLGECIDLFRKGDNPILWSSIRCYLLYNILININISRHKENGELPKKIGLPYLLMIGAFKDSFPLHDASTLEPVSIDEMQKYVRDYVPYVDLRDILDRKWGKLCSKQPIHEIRDYFGEKIAFYFAWVSTLMISLWIPTLLGLIVFFFGLTKRLKGNSDKGLMYFIEVIKSSSDNSLTPGFAAIMCLWGTIFLEVWKRRQISLAREWYVDNFDKVEPDRPQFYGVAKDNDTLGNRVLVYYSGWKRFLKYTCSFSVLLMMVMLVFISVTGVIVYRVYLTVAYCEDNAVCDLLHGTVIATLLNTLSIMILGKIYEFMAFKLTEWENHQTLSDHNDALNIKLFAFQFANTYASLLYTAFFRRDFGRGILWFSSKYKDNCGSLDNDNCMSLLSFQLLVLMVVKPFPKFVKDVILPVIKRAFRQCNLNEIDDITTDDGRTKQNYLLRELQKPSAEDFRLGEFTEKTIQYGYLVLFAASFPLAPALALAFNMIDFKIDSRRLLRWNRRPIPYRDNDIGIWFKIINFINICGVISNGFLIAFTSEMGRNQPLYIKFAIVIAFEHFIFLMKFTLSLIIPDVPTWVKNSQKKERSVLSFFMKKMPKNVPCGTSSQNQDVKINGDLRQKAEEFTRTLPKSRWSYG